MSRFLTAVLLCFSVAPWLQAEPLASFDHAMNAYESGDHEPARKAFSLMAEAGLTEAQFNLGVMLLNGQGGPTDEVDGSAWILLAAKDEHDAARQASQILAEHLGPDRMSQAESRLEVLAADYGRRQLLERHSPQTCTEDCRNEPEDGLSQWPDLQSDPEIHIRGGKPARFNLRQPSYPPNEAERGVMGAVRVGGWINEEGQIEHPHVVSAYPAGTFDRAALRAFSQWTVDWVDGAPNAAPVYHQQEIGFVIDTEYSQTLDQHQRAAREGEQDPTAVHRFIWIIDTLDLHHRLEAPIPPETVVELTLWAAVIGVPAAQIDLARRFHSGRGIEQDRESAVFWMMQAAMEGNAEAQFELSQYRQIGDEHRRALSRAAAGTGMIAAVLSNIREMIAGPEKADAEYLAELLEKLPQSYQWTSDDPIMEQARRLAESATES